MGPTPSVTTVRDDALGDHDTVGLTAALRSGSISPAEVMAAALDRMRDADLRLNGVVSWVREPSVGAGPLAGVPSVVKDNEAVAGLPTRHGSRATRLEPARHHSSFVADWTGLGLTILGTTTMPEFGLTASTEPLLTGATRNPWDTARSAGGSSGGSAALVAAGAVPIAHANDGGGSIRIPASCCGLVGMKPSRGRLRSPDGHDRLPVAITSQGALTRSVRDTALFYREMELARPGLGSLPPIGHVLHPGSRRLRIAVVREAMSGMPVDVDVQSAVVNTAALCEGLGHHVDEIDYPVGLQFGKDFLRYWAALAFAVQFGGQAIHGAGFDARQLEPFTVGLSRYFRSVAAVMPATIARLRRFAGVYEESMSGYDVVLSPVTSQPAPLIGYLAPDLDPRTHLLRLLRYASFTMIQNVSGAPAMSLPLGRTATGVPIGVQVAGASGSEALLLGLGLELEAAAPWA
jgi:amidase